MRAYYSKAQGAPAASPYTSAYDSSKLGAPYLVNMIKSIEDPTQERYVLITLTEDFHLETFDSQKGGQNKFGIMQSEVAIAVQFEDRNFQHMDLFLNQIKIQYIEQRITYVKNILNKV